MGDRKVLGEAYGLRSADGTGEEGGRVGADGEGRAKGWGGEGEGESFGLNDFDLLVSVLFSFSFV